MSLARRIVEAYRWQRRLGHALVAGTGCRLVVNPAFPELWDANHVDEVTAATEAGADAVFAAMDRQFGHTRWRVVHTDFATPDAFLARLALEDFEEQPVTIQMALQGDLTDRGARLALRPVVDDADWDALQRLVLVNLAGGMSAGSGATPQIGEAMVAAWRTRAGAQRFHLVVQNGAPVAYGSCAIAPGGVGMIEDLFTLPSARRQGLATGLVAAFTDQLIAAGCDVVFLGALADAAPKRLYARLGFRPVTLTRVWTRQAAAGD